MKIKILYLLRPQSKIWCPFQFAVHSRVLFLFQEVSILVARAFKTTKLILEENSDKLEAVSFAIRKLLRTEN